jgi:hypothetical protein
MNRGKVFVGLCGSLSRFGTPTWHSAHKMASLNESAEMPVSTRSISPMHILKEPRLCVGKSKNFKMRVKIGLFTRYFSHGRPAGAWEKLHRQEAGVLPQLGAAALQK